MNVTTCLVAIISSLVITTSSWAEGKTSFRGISIGMTVEALEKNLPKGYFLFPAPNKSFVYFGVGYSFKCGHARLSSEIIVQLEFSQCFFDQQNVDIDLFAARIEHSYGIKFEARPRPTADDYLVAFTISGEMIELKSGGVLVISPPPQNDGQF